MLCAGLLQHRQRTYWSAVAAVLRCDPLASSWAILFLESRKPDTAATIFPLSGFQVQFGECDPRGGIFVKNPNRLSHDRIILNLHPMTIAKHENSRYGRTFGCGRRRISRRCPRLFITELLNLAREPLHLLRKIGFVLAYRRSYIGRRDINGRRVDRQTIPEKRRIRADEWLLEENPWLRPHNNARATYNS